MAFAGANPPNVSVTWLGTVGPDSFGRTFNQWEISYVYGDDWTNTSWWRVTDANGNPLTSGRDTGQAWTAQGFVNATSFQTRVVETRIEDGDSIYVQWTGLNSFQNPWYGPLVASVPSAAPLENISVCHVGTIGPDIFGRSFNQWEITYNYGDDWTNSSWWRIVDINGNPLNSGRDTGEAWTAQGFVTGNSASHSTRMVETRIEDGDSLWVQWTGINSSQGP